MKPTRLSQSTAFGVIRKITAAVSVCVAMTAHAGVVLSPVAIVNNDFGANPFGSWPEQNMINQSNVSAFVSGVTDFATYVAGNPVGGCNNCAGHYFGNPVTPGNIDFDLGASVLVDQLGLFNGSHRGATRIELYTSNLADFSVSAFVGAFNPTLSGNPNLDERIQVFDLADTSARYVRLRILAHDTPCCVGISEVTFDVGQANHVPEPSPLALLAIAGAGLALCRRSLTA